MKQTNVKDYVMASFPLIAIETFQEDQVIDSLIGLRNETYSWDVHRGILKINNDSIESLKICNLFEYLDFIVRTERNSLFIIKDSSAWIRNDPSFIKIVRQIKNILPHLKNTKKNLVVIDTNIEIPERLKKDMVVVYDNLPDIEKIKDIGQLLIEQNRAKFPEAEINEEHIQCSKGLTLSEIENVYALSLIKYGKLHKDLISNERLNIVRKSNLLEIWEPVKEDLVGGLNNLKEYIRNRKKAFSDPKLPNLKGILLLGVPGTGKSLSAKMISSVLDIPLIRLDIASLKGSRVGESEKNIRNATKIIDSVAPVVLWLDEFEKAVGGIKSSNITDGGTTSGMISHLLTWQQENKNNVFTVATCNAINELPPELIRSGRFDSIFFVDLPNEEERKEIIEIQNKKYGSEIPINNEWIDKVKNWTGAEIEQLAKDSLFDGLEIAYKNITPIVETMGETVKNIRQWAKDRCRFANSPSKIDKIFSRTI